MQYGPITIESGAVPTTETSRTQQAAYELAGHELFLSGKDTSPGTWNGRCYGIIFFSMWTLGTLCTDGSWEFYVEPLSGEGTWDVVCGPDSDGDEIPDAGDNCPLIATSNRKDSDADDIGDACDADTVYGTISGDIQEGVTVGIYKPNCGGDILVDTTSTDEQGYYAFGNLGVGWRPILPELEGYTFVLEADVYPKMPQTEIRSYDFTATAIPAP
jgi:hypothetical protein